MSLKESILFLESPLRGRPEFDSFLSIFRDQIRNSEAAMGGGAHSALYGVAMNQKDGCAQRTGVHARLKPTRTLYQSKKMCEMK